MIPLITIILSGVFVETPTIKAPPAVTYEHITRDDPDMSLFIVTVDLADPRVSLKVAPGGPDPDGAGEYQTVLCPASKIAEREKFEVAINASFFGVGKGADGKTLKYEGGVFAKSVGLTMTDGRQWSEPNEGWPVVVVRGERQVSIIPGKQKPPASARQMVSGNGLLLRDGKDVTPDGAMFNARHPRTAAGVSKDGKKLILLTVDGRRAGVSVGMTGKELAQEMLRLGADDALNLDGGGSSTLVMRDAETGLLHVMNQPSDNRERSVANVIGIDVEGVIEKTNESPATQPAK